MYRSATLSGIENCSSSISSGGFSDVGSGGTAADACEPWAHGMVEEQIATEAAAGRDLPQAERDHIYGRWISICQEEGYTAVTRWGTHEHYPRRPAAGAIGQGTRRSTLP